MNFDIIKKAGLTTGDFAKIAGVSRVTVSLWVNGHALPHKLHSGLIARLLDALEVEVDIGSLPLQGVARDERLQAIRKILTKRLKEQKQAVE